MSEAIHATHMKADWLKEADGDPDKALDVAQRDFDTVCHELAEARIKLAKWQKSAMDLHAKYQADVSRGHIRRGLGA